MSFPYTFYEINSSIENINLMDSKNITPIISSYLYVEKRYKYKLDTLVSGRGLNIIYKAEIIAKNEEEFTDVFSCVMDIEEGPFGSSLTYEKVLTNCVRADEEVYSQDVPEIISLYKYRDDIYSAEYYLWFENGNYYHQYDRDEPEIAELYLCEQDIQYDNNNQLTNEKREEIKNMLSLIQLGGEN